MADYWHRRFRKKREKRFKRVAKARKSSFSRGFSDAQRAAYWKKKYFDLLKEMKGWV